jgi:HSP20 family molecular chaperone IbpA
VRGTFLRRFSLPDVADADKVSAKCKDGVLEVIVLEARSGATAADRDRKLI